MGLFRADYGQVKCCLCIYLHHVLSKTPIVPPETGLETPPFDRCTTILASSSCPVQDILTPTPTVAFLWYHRRYHHPQNIPKCLNREDQPIVCTKGPVMMGKRGG